MTPVPAMPAKQALCFGSSLNRDNERIPRRLRRGWRANCKSIFFILTVKIPRGLPRGGFNIFNSLPALPVPLF
jgi:hypothetical protein